MEGVNEDGLPSKTFTAYITTKITREQEKDIQQHFHQWKQCKTFLNQMQNFPPEEKLKCVINWVKDRSTYIANSCYINVATQSTQVATIRAATNQKIQITKEPMEGQVRDKLMRFVSHIKTEKSDTLLYNQGKKSLTPFQVKGIDSSQGIRNRLVQAYEIVQGIHQLLQFLEWEMTNTYPFVKILLEEASQELQRRIVEEKGIFMCKND